jgi:hypothetical protein
MALFLKWLKEQIIEAFKISDEVMRGKAVETIEHGRLYRHPLTADSHHHGAVTADG